MLNLVKRPIIGEPCLIEGDPPGIICWIFGEPVFLRSFLPFLLKVGGLDLGNELDLIVEGVLGSKGNPKSSTNFQSVDFDLLCFIKSPLSLCLEPDSARGRV